MTTSVHDRVTAAEAARIAHVDVSTISRWVSLGKLNADRVGCGVRSPFLIDRADIERLARERAGRLAAQVLAIQAAS